MILYNLFFKFHSKFKIQNFLTPIIFLIVACSTEPQTGSLAGTIHLSGQKDHANIAVSFQKIKD